MTNRYTLEEVFLEQRKQAYLISPGLPVPSFLATICRNLHCLACPFKSYKNASCTLITNIYNKKLYYSDKTFPTNFIKAYIKKFPNLLLLNTEEE